MSLKYSPAIFIWLQSGHQPRLQQYLKPQGRQPLLQCWLTDTLYPNKNGLKMYQGRRSSSVDGGGGVWRQRNEICQLTQAAKRDCCGIVVQKPARDKGEGKVLVPLWCKLTLLPRARK